MCGLRINSRQTQLHRNVQADARRKSFFLPLRNKLNGVSIETTAEQTSLY